MLVVSVAIAMSMVFIKPMFPLNNFLEWTMAVRRYTHEKLVSVLSKHNIFKICYEKVRNKQTSCDRI